MSENYLQISSKIVIYCLVGTHYHVDIFCDFSMFDQIFLSFKFSYLALIMKTRVCLKYFVNDCSLKVNISRSLWIQSFIYKLLYSLFFIYTEKRSKIQIYDWIRLKMPCTRIHGPYFQLVQPSYTKLQLLVIKRLLESSIA